MRVLYLEKLRSLQLYNDELASLCCNSYKLVFFLVSLVLARQICMLHRCYWYVTGQLDLRFAFHSLLACHIDLSMCDVALFAVKKIAKLPSCYAHAIDINFPFSNMH